MKSVMFFLCFIVFISCSKGDNDVIVPTTTVVLYDNVKIIDSLDLHLNPDQILLSQGKYIFSFSGLQPDIHLGDIIVGEQGNGFLRKVVSSEIINNEISLQTVQASMSNVFRKGKFRLELNSEAGRNLSSPGNFSHDFPSQTLFQSGGYSLTLNNGNINCNSNWVFDFDYDEGHLKYFEMGFKNATLNASMTTTLAATQSVTTISYTRSLTGGPNEFWRKTFKVPVVLLGVPVLLPVKVITYYDVLANSSNAIGAALSRSGTFTSNNTLNLGIKYSNGTWNEVNTFTPNNAFTINGYTVNANMETTLSLTPRIDVKFYDVLGPYVTAGPKCKFAGRATLPLTPESDGDFEITGSLIASLGAEVKILDEILVDKSLGPFETGSLSLYRRPDKILKISGDNQTGTFSEPLLDSLKVKVTDNFNFATSGVPVHFKVSQGGGNFGGQTEKIVLTDSQGIAKIRWTLGVSGTQKVLAYLKKADGSPISETLLFNATAACQIVTDFDGNNYCVMNVNGRKYIQSLRVSHYRNGDVIPQVQNASQWTGLTTGAWCYYKNISANGPIYGKLYNWYAVTDSRGLAPEGWHIPDYYDLNIENEIWEFPGGSFLGTRNGQNGNYLDIDNSLTWWWGINTWVDTDYAIGFVVWNSNNPATALKKSGLAVTCIKD